MLSFLDLLDHWSLDCYSFSLPTLISMIIGRRRAVERSGQVVHVRHLTQPRLLRAEEGFMFLGAVKKAFVHREPSHNATDLVGLRM